MSGKRFKMNGFEDFSIDSHYNLTSNKAEYFVVVVLIGFEKLNNTQNA